MEGYQYARFLLESKDIESSAKYYSHLLVDSFKGHPQELFDSSRSLFDSFRFLIKNREYLDLRNFAKTLRLEFDKETDDKLYSKELTQVIKLLKDIFQFVILIGTSKGNKASSEFIVALEKAKYLDKVTGNVHEFQLWL
jgi:hypothetical protein